MARKQAFLPEGARVNHYIRLGVITKMFAQDQIAESLRETGRASVGQRALPAQILVYFAAALPLYMHSSARDVLRSLPEVVQRLTGAGERLTVAGDAAISRTCARPGYEPVERLHAAVMGSMAQAGTQGLRRRPTVSIGGSSSDVAGNEDKFGPSKASWGRSAFPKARFVSLVEEGMLVPFGTRMGAILTDHAGTAGGFVLGLRRDGLVAWCEARTLAALGAT